MSDAKQVVEAALNAGLGWENADASLDENVRREYSQSARLILETSVWQNESKRLIDTCIRHAACKASSMEEVKDMRMTINAIVLLSERLQEIAGWYKKQEEVEDEFSGV